MHRAAIGAAILLAVSVVGCAGKPPVGLEPIDARASHRLMTESALSGERPSVLTRQVLQRQGLALTFERDPVAALLGLHAGLAPAGDEDRIFALAELAFLEGERTGARELSFAAAVYAYAFLFPGELGTPPGPFDPRFRLACEFYNRGLTAGLTTMGKGEVSLTARRLTLPFGSLEMASTAEAFTWAGFRLHDFVPVANFRVRGLRNRYRPWGLGAPFAAALAEPVENARAPRGRDHIPPAVRLPVTAVLRVEAPRRALGGGELRGELQLYTQQDAVAIEIEGRSVPLEFETSASFALTLQHSRVWELERRGLRTGNMSLLEEGFQLAMLRPYRAGLIPVVLVHGTGSSVGRWAQLINELENDARISSLYQIWLFSYNSDNPIAVSGGVLRGELTDLVRALDPEGRDPALRRLVVIGHSQGGLLAKLTAIDSGNRFWENVSDVPLAELEIRPDNRELLERSLFVTPLPFVKRLVFMATPHRGSYLTLLRLVGWSPSQWLSNLIELPADVRDATSDAVSALVLRDPDTLALRALDRLPTSIDNMTPGNKFLQTLASIPVAPGVWTHSIIAVKGDGPPERGADGVVKYSSAHLEDAESELVVRWGHSMQGRPETIEEVRRILLLHAEGDAPLALD